MNISNYSFFYQYKVFENFKIVITNIYINTIYTTKLKRFRFLNVINITLIKRKIITIIPINIKIFSHKYIKSNNFLKYKMYALQSSDFSYRYKKITRYKDIFYI